MNMSEISQRIAALTPEKRALLEKMLLEQHLATGVRDVIPRVSRADLLPLSFAQERLWFLDQLFPGTTAYNEPMAYYLVGELNLAALVRSLAEVVRRHEVLRTTYESVEGQPDQIVNPPSGVPLPVVDLSHLPYAERMPAARQHIQQAARILYDLRSDLMLRVQLLRLSATEHILFLMVHHIAWDGWSAAVFRRELSTLYTSYAAGMEPDLAELAIQYADFAAWQRQWLQGDVLQRHLDYWREHLREAPLLSLPLDRPRPPTPSHRGATVQFTVPDPVTAALHDLARQAQATTFMVLLAAFSVLLSRYSRSTDIVAGSVIANRTRREVEDLIGFFANTLALRTDLAGNPTFREVLARVRRNALRAYEHQDLPFEKLVAELQPERHLGTHPFFQVTLSFHNTPQSQFSLPGLEVASIPTGAEAAKFDLSLSMAERGGVLSGRFIYDADLFDADTVQRMAGHLNALLASAAANPDGRIGYLDLLPDSERRLYLETWNETQVAHPFQGCLQDLLAEQAARTPHAMAVRCGPAQWTYRELDERANQLAHALQALGVGPDVPVGICLERSLDMVLAILGVLKAGGAYVPLDAGYPPQRLAYMMADAQMPVLLTQAHLASRLPGETGQVICLDSQWLAIARCPSTPPPHGCQPDNLAYILYTSGSTGQPKGAAISQRAIVNHMQWMQAVFPLAADDRVLQRTPFSFDASVWEFFAPLLAGASLHLAPPNAHRDPAAILHEVTAHGITVLQVVPTLLHLLLEEPGFDRCTSLRCLFCGGEPLAADLVERCAAQLPATLHNLYGPTETTINAVTWSHRRGQPVAHVPIGRPVHNVRAYVLDSRLQPAPIGIPGELFVGGAGVGRGYWRRPELTAERFVPDPFAAQPGSRLYRTGDLARYRADGNIEYLGRMDHQVKIRGNRVELEEIEAALRRHPQVRDAAAVAYGAGMDQRLVGYLVPRSSTPPPWDSLRAFLLEQLPDYMVPSVFVTLESLPVSPSDKVDRRALPAPGPVPATAEDVTALPRTGLELAIAAIWSEVLGASRVGVDDNFFHLGGHSLLATQVVSRIRRTLQVDLPLRALFEQPTVAGLAARLAATNPALAADDAAGVAEVEEFVV